MSEPEPFTLPSLQKREHTTLSLERDDAGADADSYSAFELSIFSRKIPAKFTQHDENQLSHGGGWMQVEIKACGASASLTIQEATQLRDQLTHLIDTAPDWEDEDEQ